MWIDPPKARESFVPTPSSKGRTNYWYDEKTHEIHYVSFGGSLPQDDTDEGILADNFRNAATVKTVKGKKVNRFPDSTSGIRTGPGRDSGSRYIEYAAPYDPNGSSSYKAMLAVQKQQPDLNEVTNSGIPKIQPPKLPQKQQPDLNEASKPGIPKLQPPKPPEKQPPKPRPKTKATGDAVRGYIDNEAVMAFEDLFGVSGITKDVQTEIRSVLKAYSGQAPRRMNTDNDGIAYNASISNARDSNGRLNQSLIDNLTNDAAGIAGRIAAKRSFVKDEDRDKFIEQLNNTFDVTVDSRFLDERTRTVPINIPFNSPEFRDAKSRIQAEGGEVFKDVKGSGFHARYTANDPAKKFKDSTGTPVSIDTVIGLILGQQEKAYADNEQAKKDADHKRRVDLESYFGADSGEYADLTEQALKELERKQKKSLNLRQSAGDPAIAEQMALYALKKQQTIQESNRKMLDQQAIENGFVDDEGRPLTAQWVAQQTIPASEDNRLPRDLQMDVRRWRSVQSQEALIDDPQAVRAQISNEQQLAAMRNKFLDDYYTRNPNAEGAQAHRAKRRREAKAAEAQREEDIIETLPPNLQQAHRDRTKRMSIERGLKESAWREAVVDEYYRINPKAEGAQAHRAKRRREAKAAEAQREEDIIETLPPNLQQAHRDRTKRMSIERGLKESAWREAVVDEYYTNGGGKNSEQGRKYRERKERQEEAEKARKAKNSTGSKVFGAVKTTAMVIGAIVAGCKMLYGMLDKMNNNLIKIASDSMARAAGTVSTGVSMQRQEQNSLVGKVLKASKLEYDMNKVQQSWADLLGNVTSDGGAGITKGATGLAKLFAASGRGDLEKLIQVTLKEERDISTVTDAAFMSSFYGLVHGLSLYGEKATVQEYAKYLDEAGGGGTELTSQWAYLTKNPAAMAELEKLLADKTLTDSQRMVRLNDIIAPASLAAKYSTQNSDDALAQKTTLLNDAMQTFRNTLDMLQKTFLLVFGDRFFNFFAKFQDMLVEFLLTFGKSLGIDIQPVIDARNASIRQRSANFDAQVPQTITAGESLARRTLGAALGKDLTGQDIARMRKFFGTGEDFGKNNVPSEIVAALEREEDPAKRALIMNAFTGAMAVYERDDMMVAEQKRNHAELKKSDERFDYLIPADVATTSPQILYEKAWNILMRNINNDLRAPQEMKEYLEKHTSPKNFMLGLLQGYDFSNSISPEQYDEAIKQVGTRRGSLAWYLSNGAVLSDPAAFTEGHKTLATIAQDASALGVIIQSQVAMAPVEIETKVDMQPIFSLHIDDQGKVTASTEQIVFYAKGLLQQIPIDQAAQNARPGGNPK